MYVVFLIIACWHDHKTGCKNCTIHCGAFFKMVSLKKRSITSGGWSTPRRDCGWKCVFMSVDVCERFGLFVMPSLFCYYWWTFKNYSYVFFVIFFFIVLWHVLWNFGLNMDLFFEFDTARIMKFSRSLPAKIVFPPYMLQSSSFLWNRIYNKDKRKELTLMFTFFFLRKKFSFIG